MGKNYKIKISALKHSLHAANYVHKKDCLRSNKKKCTLHWNPGPYNIHSIMLPIIRTEIIVPIITFFGKK